jgi:hypothetical protein
MKRILLYLFAASTIISCTSSLEYMQKGQYDWAISKAKRKIIKKPSKEKEILVLEEAYKRVNDKDKERIEFLKKEGRPENWDNIFDIYSQMKGRQDNIQPLLPLHIKSKNRDAVFEILNYDDQIINAKQKAAEYFYAHALSLLESGGQQNARNAYGDLLQVKKYYNNYKDIDEQLKKAKFLGTSFVIYKMVNKTPFPLPSNFEEELTKISLSELNSDWIAYDVKPNSNTKYDYTILVNMKTIDVSPEQVKETHFDNNKEVPDGFQYLLDAKGNVRKDTSGNDLKLPKYKTIKCTVVETAQNKKAMIAGSLDFIDNHTGQIIKTDPITAESIFEHRYATAFGDLSALTPDNAAKLNNKPMPFPPGSEMVLQAGQTLKGMVKDIIWNNKGILK